MCLWSCPQDCSGPCWLWLWADRWARGWHAEGREVMDNLGAWCLARTCPQSCARLTSPSVRPVTGRRGDEAAARSWEARQPLLVGLPGLGFSCGGKKEICFVAAGASGWKRLVFLAIPGTLQSLFVAFPRHVQVLSVMITSGDTESLKWDKQTD